MDEPLVFGPLGSCPPHARTRRQVDGRAVGGDGDRRKHPWQPDSDRLEGRPGSVRIGVTVPLFKNEPARRRYTVRPSGVIVIACANGPTLIGFSTVPVAV